MGKSVLELAVNTGQWDSGLKRAQTALTNFINSQGGLNSAMSKNSSQMTKFVQMMGNMESKAATVKGKVKEYESTLAQLTHTYQQLSDKDKEGEFGKALQSSISSLTSKAKEAKDALTTVNKSLSDNSKQADETGGIIKALEGKIGITIGQLGAFSVATAAATSALKIAKDAFMSSESNIDEWGRTVMGAEGAYDIFIETINGGNWQNFFDNLSTAIRGARDLYDSLDRLGSIKNNNQAAIAIVQQQIAQLRLAKQEGKNVDAELKQATKTLRELQGESVKAGKDAGKKQMQTTIINGSNALKGVKVNESSINAAIDDILKNGQKAFDRYAKIYQNLKNKGTTPEKTEKYISSTGQTYERTTPARFDINALSKAEQRQYALARAITERETTLANGISMYAQAVQEDTSNARENFKNNRYALQGASRGGTSSARGSQPDKTDEMIKTYYRKLFSSAVTGSTDIGGGLSKFEQEQASMAKHQQQLQSLGYEAPQAIAKTPDFESGSLDDYNSRLQTLSDLLNKVAIDSEAYNNILQEMNNLQAGLSEKSATTADKISSAANAMSAMGGSMIDLGKATGSAEISIAGTIAQAIANLVAQFASMPKGVEIWSWIAGTVAGTTALVTAISSIKGATAGMYAEGGVVPGSSYYGDKLIARVNSGEAILNQRQQKAALEMMDGGGISIGAANLSAEISGEKLMLAINNNLKRRGRGELATTK